MFQIYHSASIIPKIQVYALWVQIALYSILKLRNHIQLHSIVRYSLRYPHLVLLYSKLYRVNYILLVPIFLNPSIFCVSTDRSIVSLSSFFRLHYLFQYLHTVTVYQYQDWPSHGTLKIAFPLVFVPQLSFLLYFLRGALPLTLSQPQAFSHYNSKADTLQSSPYHSSAHRWHLRSRPRCEA